MPSLQPAQAHQAGTTEKTCTKARAAHSSNTASTRQADLIPDSGYTHVPDPWYTGDFDETYRLVDAGSLALLEKLKQA